MKTESKLCEETMAIIWFERVRSKEQTQAICELQSINFKNVEKEYKRLTDFHGQTMGLTA